MIKRAHALAIAGLVLYSSSISSPANELLYELHFSRGIAAVNSLNYLDAIKEFKEALKNKPSDTRSRFYLGFCYNRLGKQKEAITILDGLCKEHPEYAEAREELGIACYYAGEYRRALDLLGGLGEFQPDDAERPYYIGLCWLALGDPKADGFFSKAGTLDPDYIVHGHYQQGLTHLSEGRMREAINEFTLAYESSPDSEIGLEAETLAQGISQQKKNLIFEITNRYEYDDNVVLMPDNGDLVAIGNQGDFRYTVTCDTSFSLPVTKLVDFYSHYQFINSTHNHLDEYNLLGNDILAGLQFNLPHVTPFTSYEYGYYFLDNCHQSYLRSQTLTNGLTMSESWFAFTQYFYRYRMDDFFLPIYYEDDNRDAGNHSVEVNQYLFLTRDARRWMSLGLAYDRNNAEGINYAYDGMRCSGEIFTPLVGGITLDCIAEYYMRNYSRSTYHRYDDMQNYTFTLGRQLNDYVGVALQYELVVNDSTVGLFQYDRDIYSLVATVRF